jgi:AAA domain
VVTIGVTQPSRVLGFLPTPCLLITHFDQLIEVKDSKVLEIDLPELEKTIEQIDDVLLVIIDPIASYLGKVDSHKNADIRSVLEPLGRMAAKQHVTIIANRHLSKAAGGSANSRVIGSVAFVNGPEGRTAIEEAKQFLIEMLGVGEVPAKEVKAAADVQMISSATLKRAKSALGVQVKRVGFGPGSMFLWSFASAIDAQSSHRCSQKEMSTYGGVEHLCVSKANLDEATPFEERAAILEYDDGLSRAEAEARAAAEFPELPDFLRRVQ